MDLNLGSHLDLEKLTPAQWKMLDDLQGNILSSHGRDHAAHLFLYFEAAEPGKQYLAGLQTLVTSAGDQVRSWQRRHATTMHTATNLTALSGELFVSVALTHCGYTRLQIPPSFIPQDVAFRAGMSQRSKLRDPPASEWRMLMKDSAADRQHNSTDIHALIILAADDATIVETYTTLIESAMPAGIRVLGKVVGKGRRNGANHRVEHFGNVDGSSSPVFTVQDTENDWPTALSPLSLVLADCIGPNSRSFGSYLVFRQLEMNPQLFEELKIHMGRAVGRSPDDAGAMIIGRRRDGTSLMRDPGQTPSSNNFDYAGDRNGTRCPFNAHARKMNPRGATIPDRPDLAVEVERKHWIVRRGISYGERDDNPAEPAPPEKRPGWGRVGLLFMCYQGSIENQFEVVQIKWANNSWFPPQPPRLMGIDPLVGSRLTNHIHEGRPFQEKPLWPSESGALIPFEIRECVRLQGGEYFFVPSISFLRDLA